MLCKDSKLLSESMYKKVGVFLGESTGERGGQIYTLVEVIKMTNIDASFHYFLTSPRITQYFWIGLR